jgi:hypothetical protein
MILTAILPPAGTPIRLRHPANRSGGRPGAGDQQLSPGSQIRPVAEYPLAPFTAAGMLAATRHYNDK